MRGLEEARSFYLESCAELLHLRFPEYEGRIAVGFAGHGSECFGFDDELSRDHDFERGCCLWLTDEDDVKIGVALARAYRELSGEAVSEKSAMSEKWLGVRRISDFYRRYTGTGFAPESWQEWLYLPSHALAEATNGEVFRDDLGEFSAIRERIKNGMPEDVRRKKLAARVIAMAQSGQYNYARCIRRGEQGAAMLALAEFVRSAAQTVFLLNRAHAPYYKWLLRAMRELPLLGSLADALEFLLTGDNEPEGQALKSQVIEDICAEIIAELKRQELSHSSQSYLEPHAFDIQSHIVNKQIKALHIMEG